MQFQNISHLLIDTLTFQTFYFIVAYVYIAIYCLSRAEKFTGIVQCNMKTCESHGGN